MSELRVDSVKSKGGGAPNLPKGVTISGIATAATLGATQIDVSNVNVSGVVTSATLNGELLSTGTPTLGLGVTINSSGVAISGVATAGIVSATTLYGDGSNITGVGATISPLFYNPDLYDSSVTLGTGIGITFNQQIKAGTGNVTLSLANAGVAGTVVENFGVGSSVSISENRITINPSADLAVQNQIYHISYPSGCFTNNEGTDFVGTAYTFQSKFTNYNLFVAGYNNEGGLGQNNKTSYSSPIQVPGTKWFSTLQNPDREFNHFNTTDGEKWVCGNNYYGVLGQNQPNASYQSSPVQIPGTTWSGVCAAGGYAVHSTKTDGTLWVWGSNDYGRLGLNQAHTTGYSSPVQLPGTTWPITYGKLCANPSVINIIKTDGTMWAMGNNSQGCNGHNNNTVYSSPTQIPGTTWSTNSSASSSVSAIKTDGTLWVWGSNQEGNLGQNQSNPFPSGSGYARGASSPVQVPGTDWAQVENVYKMVLARKTDGTLWAWGGNGSGGLGQNNKTEYSSPAQIPGTTWNHIVGGHLYWFATKTDGTLWACGQGNDGHWGDNIGVDHYYSSPVQIHSDIDWTKVATSPFRLGANKGIRYIQESDG